MKVATQDELIKLMLDPKRSFRHRELRNCQATLSQWSDLPFYESGEDSMVFCLFNNAQRWAVKCFTNPIEQNQKFYYALSKVIKYGGSPHLCEFEFLERELGGLYSVIKMPWIEGPRLDRFILAHFHDSDAINGLLPLLFDIIDDMQRLELIHGNIAPENLIVGEQIRLIDYDSMTLPDYASVMQRAHPNIYRQHSKASRSATGQPVAKSDALHWHVLLTNLMALSSEPLLLAETNLNDAFLFTTRDLTPPVSNLIAAIMKHAQPILKNRLELLFEFATLPPGDVPMPQRGEYDLSTYNNAYLRQVLPAVEAFVSSSPGVTARCGDALADSPLPETHIPVVHCTGSISAAANELEPTASPRPSIVVLLIIALVSILLVVAIVGNPLVRSYPPVSFGSIILLTAANLWLWFHYTFRDPTALTADDNRQQALERLNVICAQESDIRLRREQLEYDKIDLDQRLSDALALLDAEIERESLSEKAQTLVWNTRRKARMKLHQEWRLHLKNQEKSITSALTNDFQSRVSEIQEQLTKIQGEEDEARNQTLADQQHSYVTTELKHHLIATATILGINETDKSLLLNHGVCNAEDISVQSLNSLTLSKVKVQALLAWKGYLEHNARDTRPEFLTVTEREQAKQKFSKHRQQLESESKRLDEVYTDEGQLIKQFFSLAEAQLHKACTSSERELSLTIDSTLSPLRRRIEILERKRKNLAHMLSTEQNRRSELDLSLTSAEEALYAARATAESILASTESASARSYLATLLNPQESRS